MQFLFALSYSTDEHPFLVLVEPFFDLSHSSCSLFLFDSDADVLAEPFSSRISPDERRRLDIFFLQTDAWPTSPTYPRTDRSLIEMAHGFEREISQSVRYSIATGLDRSMGMCDERVDPSTYDLRQRKAQHHVSFLHVRTERLPYQTRKRTGRETHTDYLCWSGSNRINTTNGSVAARNSTGQTNLRWNQSTGIESNHQSMSTTNR